MNESEQAQAIAEIKGRRAYHFANNMEMHGLMKFVDSLRDDYVTALEIVDSQAQKIEQLEKDFNLAATIAQEHKDKLDAITEGYADYKHKSGAAVVDLIDKNNEQAKELAEARAIAEKMRDRSERPGGGHAFLPWEKQ